MRVVSFVPSWTETLLHCGVEVVGRTRFCQYPQNQTFEIPILGGTKDLDLEQLKRLQPDLVLFDREENTHEMALRGQSGGKWKLHSTHVQSVEDMAPELLQLASILKNEKLKLLAKEWEQICSAPWYPNRSLEEIPGIEHWIQKPNQEPEQFLYLIWRSPWMTVSRDTFVGSIFQNLGFGNRMPKFEEKYPRLDLGNYDPEKTLLLFSSEPFPFRTKAHELRALGFPSAIICGESYSWFGLRSLRFLQSLQSQPKS